ncbi:HAD family hydrolase [Streptomyces harbinensis]|uniref:HAD family hydrolase n=1 Tax=Streptomyces harbinensis TaxID=1176198 RepID=UPI00371813F9
MTTVRPAAAALVFDLDGTLVDSEPHYYEANRRVLAGQGVRDFSWERYTHYIGIGALDALAAQRAEYRIATPAEELLAEQDRVYLELIRGRIEVFPGMARLVELAHAAGLPMAVASGSTREAIDAALTGTAVGALLPVRVSAEEVPRGKPAPDVFEAAAHRLGVPPQRCVVVEDAAPGVTAALAAGMRCVAVPSVLRTADEPVFASAGLCFPGGQETFDAEAVLAWVRERADGAAPATDS